MTLDERLEALTQSVELLSRMHQDNERNALEARRANDERVEALAESVELLAGLHRQNETVFKDLFNRMGRILEHHDITLDDHKAGWADSNTPSSKAPSPHQNSAG